METSEKSKESDEAADAPMEQATPLRRGIRIGVAEGKRRIVTAETAAAAENEAEAEAEEAVAEVGRSRRKRSAATGATLSATKAEARVVRAEEAVPTTRAKQGTATGKGVTRAVARCADSPVRYMQKLYEQMTRGERMLLATRK